MHYVKEFNINGVATKQVACIELHGKPNAATEGYVGVLGVDVDSPTHDVYKCVAVNGSIYTWELLSSGLSIMSSSINGEGKISVQFAYDTLKTPPMYTVKKGDLILDTEGYLYQIDSIFSTYCVATYCGTQIAKYGKSGVYVGSEEPPHPDINVWIDPDGDVDSLVVQTTGDSETQVMSQKAIRKNFQELSKNLLDYKNVELYNYSLASDRVDEYSYCRSFCIDITNAGADKVRIHVGALTNRLNAVTSPTPMEKGPHGLTTVVKQEFASEGKTVTLDMLDGTTYLWCYFYNSRYDTLTVEEILSSMTVQYYVPKNTARIEAIEKAVINNNRWNTRNKIYGIQFDTEGETLTCERIADSVGNSAELKDFDNIYPWSDIRLCNVKVENGKKTIVYEGQSAFTRDGTNGNVMVEIPAFYVCRERIGTTERWLISGEKKGGFELHPWFRNADGTTVERRYYGVYKASIDMREDNVFSHSGGTPFMYKENDLNMQYVTDFAELLSNRGYSRNTIYALSAIQYLFCIEYATLNTQSIMNGVTYCPYFSGSNSYLKIKNVGERTNTFTLNSFVGTFGNTFTYLGEGMQVCVDTAKNRLVNKRNIVSIESDSSNIYVTVDGEPVTVTENMYCFPIPQDNGLTDSMGYHTGTLTAMNKRVAPFKYRNIENVWGDLWEALDGIRIINGKYYLSNENNYHETNTENWKVLGYSAPMVTATDAILTNRIARMGVDNEHMTVCLPDLLSSDVSADITYEEMANMYFGGDAYYSADEMTETAVYIPLYGGGWDHHENAGLFCMRFLNILEGKNWLYGERITC